MASKSKKQVDFFRTVLKAKNNLKKKNIDTMFSANIIQIAKNMEYSKIFSFLKKESNNYVLTLEQFTNDNDTIGFWNAYMQLVDVIDGIISENGELNTNYWNDTAYTDMEKILVDLQEEELTTKIILKNYDKIFNNMKMLLGGLTGYTICGHKSFSNDYIKAYDFIKKNNNHI